MQYPIGKFEWSGSLSEDAKTAAISDIESLPAKLRVLTAGLSDAQLETPYREGGWTIRQVVHHLADSHMNSYVRVRLALTQDNPTICAYDEAAWATFPDAQSGPLEPSLQIIEGVHARWTVLWKSLADDQFERPFTHPQYGPQTLARTLALYSWHGRHHLAHIEGARKASGL